MSYIESYSPLGVRAAPRPHWGFLFWLWVMKVNDNWVYVHLTPDGMVYVGRSSRGYTEERWLRENYKGTSLNREIELWGWENIKHILISDGLSYDESYKLEQELIRFARINGVCINERNSGLLWSNDPKNAMKEYWKDYYRKNRKKIIEYNKERHRRILQRKKLLSQIQPDGCLSLW